MFTRTILQWPCERAPNDSSVLQHHEHLSQIDDYQYSLRSYSNKPFRRILASSFETNLLRYVPNALFQVLKIGF